MRFLLSFLDVKGTDEEISRAVIASVPLLVTYAAGHGVTDVVLPNIFGIRELFNVVSTNGVLHLGAFAFSSLFI